MKLARELYVRDEAREVKAGFYAGKVRWRQSPGLWLHGQLLPVFATFAEFEAWLFRAQSREWLKTETAPGAGAECVDDAGKLIGQK